MRVVTGLAGEYGSRATVKRRQEECQTEANAQLFSRLFQRRCCPDPCPQYRAPVYTQPTCCGYGSSSPYQNHTHGSYYGHAQNGVGQPSYGGIVTTPHGNFTNLGVYSSNLMIPDATSVYSTAPGYGQLSDQVYSSTDSYDPTQNYVPNQNGISSQSQSAQRVQSTMQDDVATSEQDWGNSDGWNRDADSPTESRDRRNDRPDSSSLEGTTDSARSDEAFSPPQVDQAWSQSSNSDSSTENDRESLTTLYAGKLYLANHCAVELSKMAEEMTSTPEVRQFAETIARDHAALNEKLKPHISTQVASTFSDDRNSDTSTELDQAMTTLERHRTAANELQKALAPAPPADVASDGIAPTANR